MSILTYLDDITVQIFHYAIEKLFDIIKLANISNKFYDLIDKHFDKFFSKLIIAGTCDEILFITLQSSSFYVDSCYNLTDYKNLIRLLYRKKSPAKQKLKIYFYGNHNLFGRSIYQILNNYNMLDSSTIKYLLMVKYYSKINDDNSIMRTFASKSLFYKRTRIEHKLSKIINKYWQSKTKKFCLKIMYMSNYDKIISNCIQTNVSGQLMINTLFVKYCIWYDRFIDQELYTIAIINDIMLTLLNAGADIRAGFNTDGSPITLSYFYILCNFLYQNMNFIPRFKSINLIIENALGCLMGSNFQTYEKLINLYTNIFLEKINIVREPFTIKSRELYIIFNPL